jgi:hypothetical protein
MKAVVFCFCLLLLPCTAQTSVKRTATSTHHAAQNLKDGFAKSALQVTKMVDGETGKTSLGEDGSMLVPRETDQAIDDLDVDAQTKEEIEIVRMLNAFFMAKLSHNMRAHILSLRLETGSVSASTVSAIVETMHTKDAACSDGLEAVLRARSYHDVEACSDTALTVPIPD